MQAAICAETGRLRRRARGVVQPRAMIAGMEARFVTRIGIVLALCGVLLGVQGCVAGAEEAVRFGPQATESAPDRRQAWAIPVPAPVMAARAVLFRPPPPGRGSDSPRRDRPCLGPKPAAPRRTAAAGSFAAVGALVALGVAVLVPERPAHGVTGGHCLEDQGRATAAGDRPRQVCAEERLMSVAATFGRVARCCDLAGGGQ